jgi:carbonic anhydrase
LLLVLGHEEYGAVKAALEGQAPGAVGELIKEIGPAVRPVLDQGGEVEDIVLEAVQANVWPTMGKLIERSPVIAAAVRSGTLELAGAVYSFLTGKITVLEEEG